MKLRKGKNGSTSINLALAAMLSVAAAAPVNGVAASLTTSLTGTNNDLVFTAKLKGVAGNAITIAYIDPGEETATETVVVTGSNIVVTLRSVDSVLSTSAQVKTAIEANALANALVSIANSGADTGEGAVIAMAEDALEGGVDCTVKDSAGFLYHDGYLYFTPAETRVSDDTWRRLELSALA